MHGDWGGGAARCWAMSPPPPPAPRAQPPPPPPALMGRGALPWPNVRCDVGDVEGAGAATPLPRAQPPPPPQRVTRMRGGDPLWPGLPRHGPEGAGPKGQQMSHGHTTASSLRPLAHR